MKPMTRPGLLEGIAVALIASIAGSAIFVILTSVFSGNSVVRLLMAASSLAYMVYLLTRSNERVGRLTAIAVWLVIAAIALIFAPSLLIYISIHLVMLWLIRSLYFYDSVLSALVDLGLTGVALVTAIWAWLASNNLFLAFWCFFLVQALFVLIPRQWSKTLNYCAGKGISSERACSEHACLERANGAVFRAHGSGLFDSDCFDSDPFETAHGAAERALAKLMSR